MKQQTKRILSLLLCMAMLISLVPTMALGASAAGTRTIYFDNSGKNWSTVNVYAWSDAGNFTGEWPGTAMSYVEGSLYACEVSTDAVNIIFNNGSGSQTGDLTIPTDGSNLFGADENWYTYTQPETAYYLVGFINGANVGCEEDYLNMGPYKFVDGQLTVNFTTDSYVFIKTEGNGKWFMAESYCTDTICRFQEGWSEKMLVPGNVEVTFTLSENADGALWLSYQTASADCSHDYKVTETVAPTCTAEGKDIYTCSKCGNQYTSILGAKGHSYSEKVTTAATCTESGVKTFTCTACGDSYTEVIPANGHSYEDGKCTVCGKVDPNCTHSYTSKVTVAATCTKAGVKTYTCSKCGDVYTEEIAATGHSYVDIVVPPTCENNGYTRHQCSACGEYGLNTDPVNPIGHSYESVVTPPTCTEKGYTTYTCSNCGNVYTWNETAATGHSYDKGACTVCGALDPNYTVTDTGFVLVTDLSGITDGKYVIVAKDSGLAMGTTLTSGKFAGVSVTVDGRIVTGDNLPVWTVEVVDGGITLHNGTSYLAYASSANFKLADAAYTWTVEEGVRLTASTATRGIYMQLSSSKFGAYATSSSANSYVLDLQLYKYQIGSQGCSHIYENGTCTLCGTADPSYDWGYYLFGYINGADYGIGDDQANLGTYKFEDGKLTAKFTEDSYVAVKSGDNASFYMTNGWIGSATSATLYKFTDPYSASANKLLVPGGQTLHFTLTENWDGNLTISYTVDASDCQHVSHNTDGTCTTCGTTVEHTYSLGVCTVCGAQDPYYAPYVYYLFGYINNANYGCEEDASNLGEYLFADGKLTTYFEADSYVGVKEVNPGAKFGPEVVCWYMTDGWQGEVTSATLYDSTSLSAADKLFVPGNADVTFTMVKNEDGTVTLSYEAVPRACEHSYTSEVTTAATCTEAGVKTYTCSKCGDSYTESIAATGHKFSGGSCTVCGALDPNYTVTDTGFVLVTDLSGITDGKYVIVAKDSGLAMGTTLTSGKFAGVSVTVDGRIVTGDNLPVWTVEVVDGGIALSVDGQYLAYNSSTNFKFADTASAWSVADGFVLTDAASGRGIYMQISSSKFGAYASATSSYVSNLQLYKYQVGNQGCSHEYSEAITTEATCDKAGVKTFTCGLCGHVYTAAIPALGHSFVNGTCTTCGSSDPDFQQTYYLVGYINGANHGCEEDYENMGSYKFVGGKLTASFETDSYVFLKTEGNAKWYMSESYCTDTTCTFIEGGTEKLFVPGNAEITFTLTENGDGTLTLSYVAVPNACEHSYTSEVTTAATCTEAGVKTYTCSKCGDSYTESIAATGHKFSGGSCTVCGALDPNYTVTDTGFVLVTDLSGITDGKYVIVANNSDSYLAMGTALTSGKFAGVSVTVDGRIVTGDNLPVWTVEVVDGGIALSVDGQYLAYNASTNFKFADTASAWSVADGFVLTDAASGRGIYMQISSSKFGAYASATSSYISELQLYKYQVGTQGCSHDYKETVTAEATCDKAGVKTFTCNLCDHSYTQSIPAIGHSYTSKVTTAATCTAPGVKTYTCANCGGSYTESIPATGHSFSSGKCTVCGAVDPNCTHSYTSKVTTAATCTTAGVRTYTCSMCGSSYTEAIAATGHSYTSKVTTAATCDKAGVKTYTCSKCSDSYTEAISATGHSYKSVVTAPTCTAQGYTTYTCSVCGNSYKGSYTTATGHSYTSKVTTAATCTAPGVKTYTCSKCANSYTESIPATGHSFSSGKCTVCGTVDPNCSHSYTSKVTTAATCTKAGVRTYTCSMCGSSYTEAIAATGHSYTGSVTTAATCTTAGVKTYTCSNCSDSYTEAISATGHNFVGGTCTNCGASDGTSGLSATYYLVGYINGADHGCEGDYQNMGNYKLEGGTLTTSFQQDSYVFVKTEGNGKWLLANAYCEDTTCTFVEGGTEKMFVPGGVTVTFTIRENADGSVTLSYTTASTEPSTAPTITLKYPSLSFEDMIVMNVYYSATDLQDVVEMGLVTYTTKPTAASVSTADKVIPGYTWSDADQLYYSTTAGIAPKDLGDTMHFAVYYKLKDGTYGYTKVAGYSPKTYALGQLNTGTAEMKALVVAMLNYGAAAQVYFNYKTDSLMNATLTSAQQALVASYSDSMITTVTQASGAKLGTFINDSTYTKRYPTISFEGAFCINYYFQPSLAVKGDVTMYIWSLEDFNAASVLTKANATKAVKMELTSTGEYLATVDGIAAKHLDKAAYVSFVYSDGTTEHCGGVLGYTIGMYCKSQASKTGTLADLAKACAVYGYYAKQLFNK